MQAAELVRDGIIPVIVLDDVSVSDDLSQALTDAGLATAEVTLRTPNALQVIERMASSSLVVGAGTVVNAEQVQQAVDAGARFIVSPGLSRTVVDRARDLEVPVLPGVVSPTDVMAALDLGLNLLKFFPAGSFGGPATLKAFASPFGQVRFVPTGGISQANLSDYLQLPNVAAVGGSWMVDASLILARDFARITELTHAALQLATTLKGPAA